MSSIQILYINTFLYNIYQNLGMNIYEICIFLMSILLIISAFFLIVVVIVVLIIIGFSLVCYYFLRKPCHNDEFTIISIV